MKNVGIDNIAIMTGKNWVATPFCLNYGYENHGMEETYVGYELEKKIFCRLNFFGMSKRKFCKEIVRRARPKTFPSSFYFGDMSSALIGAPIKEYNVIQLLFEKNKMRLVAGWLDGEDISYHEKITSDNYVFLAEVPFASDRVLFEVPKIMTCCVMLFKYTAHLYRRELYFRFEKSFTDESNCYGGLIRMDSGIDEDTGRLEQFSTIKTMNMKNSLLPQKCIDIISALSTEVFE